MPFQFLQSDPVPGGSANAYTYTFGDPINSQDPTGAITYGTSTWLNEANNQQDQEIIARETARETLERAEAERREQAAINAAMAAGPQYWGSEEEWGEEYEEWEEYEEVGDHREYTSNKHDLANRENGDVEPAVLYEPLSQKQSEGVQSENNAAPTICTGACSYYAYGRHIRHAVSRGGSISLPIWAKAIINGVTNAYKASGYVYSAIRTVAEGCAEGGCPPP